jgi:hypothetical protein
MSELDDRHGEPTARFCTAGISYGKGRRVVGSSCEFHYVRYDVDSSQCRAHDMTYHPPLWVRSIRFPTRKGSSSFQMVVLYHVRQEVIPELEVRQFGRGYARLSVDGLDKEKHSKISTHWLTIRVESLRYTVQTTSIGSAQAISLILSHLSHRAPRESADCQLKE